MPANVYRTANRDFAAYGHNAPAWHRFGHVKDGTYSLEELREATGITDEKLSKVPVYFPVEWDATGKPVRFNEMPEHFVVSRTGLDGDGDGKGVGVVGSIYRPVPIVKALEVPNAIVEGGEAKWDALTLLGERGERFVAMLELADNAVEIRKGDFVYRYLAAMGSHDGSLTNRYIWTQIRGVCANTVAAIVRSMQAGEYTSIRHSGNIDAKHRAAARILANTAAEFERFEEWQRRLLEVELTPAFVEEYAETLFPKPATKATTESGAKRSETIRANKILALKAGVTTEIAMLPQWTATGLAANNGKPVPTMYDLFNGLTRAVDHELINGRDGGNAFEYATLGGGGSEIKRKGIELLANMSGVELK